MVSAITSSSYTITIPAATDAVGVAGYEYSLNGGAYIGMGLTANIAGRASGSTDTVAARAFDAAGNRSTPALTASVTLLSLVPVPITGALSGERMSVRTMYRLNPPTPLAVTVAEAKFAARLDGSHWDAPVAGMIAAAQQVAEHETGLRLTQQVWRHELDAWPAAGDLLPELRPSAVAVSYWTGSTWDTLDPASYAWASAGSAGWETALAPVIGGGWPALGAVALGPRVRIDVTSGAADASSVPSTAAQFIKALVALLVADPTLTAEDAMESHKYLRHILNPVRLYR